MKETSFFVHLPKPFPEILLAFFLLWLVEICCSATVILQLWKGNLCGSSGHDLGAEVEVDFFRGGSQTFVKGENVDNFHQCRFSVVQSC